MKKMEKRKRISQQIKMEFKKSKKEKLNKKARRLGGRGSCDAIKLAADGIQTSVASATKAKEMKEQSNVARGGEGRRSKRGSKWKGGKCFKLRAS